MDLETGVTYCGVELTVKYEKERYEREPYSWGQSRGYETEYVVYSVLVNDVDIIGLLSQQQIEEIEEIIKDQGE